MNVKEKTSEIIFPNEQSYLAYVWDNNNMHNGLDDYFRWRKSKKRHYILVNDEDEQEDDYDEYLEEQLDKEREKLVDYIDELGVQYSLKKKILVLFPKTVKGKYTIPDGIIAIHNKAFLDCNNLCEIDFPNTLCWIGDSAFENCSSLKQVSLPSDIRIVPENCFRNCLSLKDILLPDSLKEIKSNAFNGCSALEKITIPRNVQHIGQDAFCLTEIKFVTWNAISVEDFQRVENDEYGRKVIDYNWCIFDDYCVLQISFGEGVVHIPAYLMYNQSIEELILPSSLESIGDQAFSGCKKLGNIRFPKKLSHIGIDAFENIYWDKKEELFNEISTYSDTKATALLLDGIPDKYKAQIHIEDLNSWCRIIFDSKYSNPLLSLGLYADIFINGVKRETLVVDENVDVLNNYCFAGWTTIKKVKLPSTIKRIGCYAFYKCKNLRKIHLQGDIDVVELSAFNYCEILSLNNEYEHFKQTSYSIEISPKHKRFKVYDLSSLLTFGKYQNKSINTIIKQDVDYLIWCISHLDKFALSIDVLRFIITKYPTKWRAISVYGKFEIAPYSLNSPYRYFQNNNLP